MLTDAILLGAAAGLLSTVLMTAFEAVFWSSWGLDGVVEWQVNQILVSMLLREKYDKNRRLGEGLAMHQLHGTVAGAVLAAILFSFFLASRGFFWIAGVFVSLLLWSIVPFLLRRQLESKGGVLFTNRGLAVSLLSHVVYGLSLGLIFQFWL